MGASFPGFMKDCYKILGIKENASEEEIRARWIRLMRRFHPDRHGRKESLERKAKEINEAYQVLKDESTRMEYDLKRNYYRGKNRLLPRRRGFLTGLLGILFVIGLIFLLKFFPQINSPLTPGRGDTGTPRPEEAATLKREEPKTSRQADAVTQGTRDIKRPKQAKTKTRGREDRGTEGPKDATILRQQEPKVSRQADAVTLGRDDTTTPGLKGAIALRQAETETLGREDRSTERPKDAAILSQEEPKVPRQADAMTLGRDDTTTPGLKDATALRQAERETLGRGDAGTQDPMDAKAQRQIDAKAQRNEDTSHRVDPIANEEEVKHFFGHYIDRYVRKDIDGFLSCFSSKAIQNRTEKLQGIRKIYAAFFKQSRDLRYELQDWRTDFYQNGVAVMARYQLDQVLKKGGRRTWKGDIRWTLIKEEGALKILFLDYQQQK